VRTFQELEQNIEEFLGGEKGLKIHSAREIDERQKNNFWGFSSGVKVLIGKESKIPCAKDFSVILGSAKFPKKRKGAFAILGPKRMHYSRNIGLVNSLVKFLEKC
jgi:heat-inducible transcriptional repressor